MDYSIALEGYSSFDFDNGRWTRRVYRRGVGPAVIVIHEMPGLHPLVIRFADRVAAAGMTVFLPSLTGQPGRPVTPGYLRTEILKLICIRREFNLWRLGRSSPIVEWLRALARRVHSECGGTGVGAIGMCLTGGFALAMMTEPVVVAPVLSQPSLPIGTDLKHRAAIDMSDEEIACVRQRFVRENLSAIALRFKSDANVPDERFATYKDLFGDRFETIELDDIDAAPGPTKPHSVLTLHLIDEAGSKTTLAEEHVVNFFRVRAGASDTS
jgi:dienelactone hydrolase